MPDFKDYSAADFLAEESFVNYLLKKNKTDTELWQARISAGNVNEKEFMLAKQLFFVIKQGLKSADKNEELNKLQSMIAINAKDDTNIQYLTQYKKKIFRLKPMWAAAAAVIFCIAIWQFNKFRNDGSDTYKSFTVFAKAAASIYTTVLPDGTHVMLNKNSSVSIGENFNLKKREVILKGTAFFEVTKNPEKPFKVISGDVSTTALGTSFYIHQSSNTAPTTVSLMTGKVQIDTKDRTSIHLVPFEKALYNNGQPIKKEIFDNVQLLNWTNGIVKFKNAGLLQIKNSIEEFFDKRLIINGGPSKDISFTGEFKADNLESILESLRFTYDLKYTVQDTKITITF
jgi:transmembrane sensor